MKCLLEQHKILGMQYGCNIDKTNTSDIEFFYNMDTDLGEGRYRIYNVNNQFLTLDLNLHYKHVHTGLIEESNCISLGYSTLPPERQAQNGLQRKKEFYFHKGSNKKHLRSSENVNFAEAFGFVFDSKYYNRRIQPLTNIGYDEFAHAAHGIHLKQDIMQLNTLFKNIPNLPSNNSFKNITLEAKLMDIIGHILLIHERNNHTMIKNKVKRFEYEQINIVKECIDENYMNLIRIDDLAKQAFLGKTKLSQLFKEINRMTISEYICQVRMDKAKKLLKTSDKAIKEISLLIGYHRHSSFSEIFKKIEGITPKEYRFIHKI